MVVSTDFLPGNRLTLLNSGAEFFPELLAALNSAQHEIHLQSYIFEADATGLRVAAALKAAALRGVRVHVLVDGFGSRDFSERIMQDLKQTGVMAMLYRPDFSFFRLRRHRLRRLHCKLAVIDGQIAFIGGINIIDDLNHSEQAGPRYDYAVRVEGPVLKSIRHSMLRTWGIVVWASFKQRYRTSHELPALAPISGNQRSAFVVRDNIRHRRDIENAYLAAISEARQSILIANAYFLPGRRFRRALNDAAKRGVSVRILLQGRVEYRLLHYATQALYGKLLNSGVRIFEYQRSFLHAKVAVIDDVWATVGSSNIDPFSLLLSKEANLLVQDSLFATQLRNSLEQAMQNDSVELPPQSWVQLPWYSQFVRRLSYSLIRVAVGLSGYGNKN